MLVPWVMWLPTDIDIIFLHFLLTKLINRAKNIVGILNLSKWLRHLELHLLELDISRALWQNQRCIYKAVMLICHWILYIWHSISNFHHKIVFLTLLILVNSFCRLQSWDSHVVHRKGDAISPHILDFNCITFSQISE